MLCLLFDQSEFMALFMVFNWRIGTSFIFESINLSSLLPAIVNETLSSITDTVLLNSYFITCRSTT